MRKSDSELRVVEVCSVHTTRLVKDNILIIGKVRNIYIYNLEYFVFVNKCYIGYEKEGQ